MESWGRWRASPLHNVRKWEPPPHSWSVSISHVGLMNQELSFGTCQCGRGCGRTGICVAVKLRGWINDVKVIIRPWMLVERGQREPSAIGSGPPAPTHAHPRWPHKFPKGWPESWLTFFTDPLRGQILGPHQEGGGGRGCREISAGTVKSGSHREGCKRSDGEWTSTQIYNL